EMGDAGRGERAAREWARIFANRLEEARVGRREALGFSPTKDTKGHEVGELRPQISRMKTGWAPRLRRSRTLSVLRALRGKKLFPRLQDLQRLAVEIDDGVGVAGEEQVVVHPGGHAAFLDEAVELALEVGPVG